ncbi:LON peptidase N-terminal domain and RING finger protein 3-like isoform X1 [Scylla paramamosain]|uniref:LON peptidase N-terminal domain and RING finger protein 3-like isoform X1 n=2 Tax=Scylla paramamosain TaxID=85552 RepID=UPI0030837BBD
MPPSRRRVSRSYLPPVVGVTDEGETHTGQETEEQFPSREQRRNSGGTFRARAGNTMEGNVQEPMRNLVRASRLRARNSREGSVQEPRRNPVRTCRVRARNTMDGSVRVLQDVRLVLERFPSPPHLRRLRGAARRARSTDHDSRPRTSDTPQELHGSPQPSRAQPSSVRREGGGVTQSNPQEDASSGTPPRLTLQRSRASLRASSRSRVQDPSRAQIQASSHTPNLEPPRPSSHTQEPPRPSSHTEEPSRPSSHTEEPSRISLDTKEPSPATKEPSPASSEVQTQGGSGSPPRAARRQPRRDATREPHVRCLVCLDSLGSIKLSSRAICSTVCGHLFCSTCIETAIELNKCCPLCRRRLNNKKYHALFL